MSETTEFGHGEFKERMAAYLSGGLEGRELSLFEEHRDACAACAAELKRVEEADRMLVNIFANARPGAGFEDRIVSELRSIGRPMRIMHPAVLKVASGIAAAILVASVGYLGNHLIVNNKLPGAARVAQHEVQNGYSNLWVYDSDGDTSGKDSLESYSRGRAKDREEWKKEVD